MTTQRIDTHFLAVPHSIRFLLLLYPKRRMSCFVQIFICLVICSFMSSVMSFQCRNDVTTESCSDQWDARELPVNSCSVQKANSCTEVVGTGGGPPLQVVETEEEATFEFTLTPYPRENPLYKTGMNLSLHTHNSEITGFYFFVQQNVTKFYNFCRVFDFTQVKHLYPDQEMNLYYDCLWGFDINWRHYVTIVRAIPINRELQYMMYVPTSEEMRASNNLCAWRPLALLNLAALSQKKVDVMFSPVNSSHMVDEYSLMVVCGVEQRIKSIPAGGLSAGGQKMHRITLSGVPSGSCEVAVIPVSQRPSCQQTFLFKLNVPPEPDVTSFPWYYLLVTFLVLLLLIALVYFVVKRYKVNVLPRPRALLIYSNDCPEHLNVVLKLYEFLKACCSVDAVVDRWDMRGHSPEDWVSDAVQKADCVVLVVSEGVKHKVEGKNEPPMIETSPYGDRFTPAYKWLLTELEDKNPPQLIKVIFSAYGEESLVPRKLRNKGKSFFLMRDTNRFLCHIHRNSLGGLFRLWPIMPGSTHGTHLEGKALTQALEQMGALRDQNPDWFREQLQGHQEVGVETSTLESSVLIPMDILQ